MTLGELEEKLATVRAEMERVMREAEQRLQAYHGAVQMLEELVTAEREASAQSAKPPESEQ